MSPNEQPLNERVAAMEPQLEDIKTAVGEFRQFKETMIKELADLSSTVKTLGWRVSIFTGAIVVVLEQVAQWGFKKLLP